MVGNRNAKSVLEAGSRFSNQEVAQEEQSFRRPHAHAFGVARDYSKEDVELEACFMTGDAVQLSYSSRTIGIYDKGGTILAYFDGAVVVIEGRNLDELATLLKQHQAEYIQERHGPKDRTGRSTLPDTEPYIDKITLYSKDLWSEVVEKYSKIEINNKLLGEKK